MKITKISIPQDQIINGLKPVKMQKLGQVVLIAGKNGSGKSRLLNLILEKFSQKPTISLIQATRNNFDLHKESIAVHNTNIKILQEKIDQSQDDNTLFEKNIAKYKRNLKATEKAVAECENIFNWNLVETDTLEEAYTIIPFIPKTLDLADSNNLRRSVLKQQAGRIDKIGINYLASGTFARIQIVQDRYNNATHQNTKLSQDVIDNAISDYKKLKHLIHIILNAELDRNQDGDATIFGFPLGQAKLSDGQKILIQLCLAIHCQNKSLNKLILFLDEPENHLHPSVIIDTINRIREHNPNGQIWIATHSIPVLSAFDPSNIWYVEDGKVEYAGTVPENVLKSLLGDEEQIAKLQDFISLPGILAMSRHAYESLFHPKAIMTNKDDVQGLQIRDEIKNHLNNQNKIRIIDYGAGKGRLLANIIENSQIPVSELITKLDYIAFDVFDNDKIDCLSVLKKIYPDYEKRYFNDFNSLYSKYDKESFDIVIMCNVLHEIDPNYWLKLFSTDGEVTSLLSKKGILLVVEDQEMLVGEKAYQKGFVVLDTPELKEVFCIKEQDTDFGFSTAKGGRLKAHRITKELLERITTNSRTKAFESLNRKASINILKIRKQEINYKNGKKHGFWVQQLANTSLCLAEWTSN